METIVNPSDNNRLKLKLRDVKLNPCKVAIIVHIQIIDAKKIDDANKVIIKDLYFICFLSYFFRGIYIDC